MSSFLRIAAVGQLSDLYQLQAKRLNSIEQAMQRGLVEYRSTQHGLYRAHGGIHALEDPEQLVADSSLDVNLIVRSFHTGHLSAKLRPDGMNGRHPTGMMADFQAGESVELLCCSSRESLMPASANQASTAPRTSSEMPSTIANV